LAKAVKVESNSERLERLFTSYMMIAS